ncbi:uncharacterized protein LOC129309671 [Prosopis cineraria]|uniref:uncharacterized protein LOC129309671 n=1 Tax=Prosopis cineraria TaxID=364024 RepID=UPI0024109602|nr:uncharacterized protein LOC129309671 [Prosopis cineraria]XP_054807305.1 uncharacterized protein LOC129309671 [Prosopis cineraria]
MLSSGGDIDDVFFDSADYLSPQESDSCSNELDYEIWVNQPQSVKERRQRFLEGMGLSGLSVMSSKPYLGLERVRDTNEALSNADEKETSEANILFDEINMCPKDEVDVSFHEHRNTEADVQEGHGDLGMDKKKKKNWWKRFLNKKKESGREKIRLQLNKEANKTHRIKVRQHKKRWMELSGLYVGQEITAHNGFIWTMKFSPNGEHLATGGEDGVVRIWRVVLQDTSSDCFNAEDSLVSKVKQDVFCSWKKQSSQHYLVLPSKVFQIEESPLQEFYGHSSDVLDLAWSNSEILLSSSADKTVRLWRIGCDQCLSVFCHNDYVTCIQVNPVDESYFITGSIDGKVRIWGVHEERVVDWADIHDVITAISYKPDGKGFVVGSISGTCRFYVASDKHCRLEAQIHVDGKKRSRGNKISGIQFSQEEHQRVLITSEDSKFCLWEGIDVVHKYRGLSKSGSQTFGSFTSNGKHIISVGEDSHVYIWNTSDFNKQSPKHRKTNGSCEYFFSEGTVIAVPWSGMSTDQIVPSLAHCSSELQNQMVEDRECFSHSNWFSIDHTCRGSVTWPEEKLPVLWNSHSAVEDAHSHQQKMTCPKDPWGLSIVTASCDGTIKTFHNFGLPVRL